MIDDKSIFESDEKETKKKTTHNINLILSANLQRILAQFTVFTLVSGIILCLVMIAKSIVDYSAST